MMQGRYEAKKVDDMVTSKRRGKNPQLRVFQQCFRSGIAGGGPSTAPLPSNLEKAFLATSSATTVSRSSYRWIIILTWRFGAIGL